jgi:glycosyltransferase involved in cell wall biosynthesis
MVEKNKESQIFVSIVIPLFNEEASLRILQQRLHKVMEKLSFSYEIIYVDDASKDASLEVIKELQKQYPLIRIISFRKNHGQSTALCAGFRMAKGRWIITLDADLQNPPEEIPTLLKFKEEFDFITGIRKDRKDNFIRKLSSSTARFFRWLILKDVTIDTGCSLRMFKREILNEMPRFKNFHRFFTFLVRMLKFKVKEIPVQHNRREFGASSYGIIKRASEGIFDLIGILWLKRRLIHYDIKYKH